jgi:hypothetical protein
MDTNNPTESPLHVLRHERDLLHRPLPPLLQLAAPLAHPPWRPQRAVFHRTWLASRPEAVHDVQQPLVRWRYGDGSRQQDGLDSPLDLCFGLGAHHGYQAVHQYSADGQCESMAG